MVRKTIKRVAETNPKIQALLPYVKENVGLLLCKDDLSGIRNIILEHKVAAPAKVGAICPNDVIVRAGATGMDPAQTAFLQALNISSRINRGQVDIINDVKLLHAGQKVGQSEAALLQKLNIKPFTYGLIVQTVYDEGYIYEDSGSMADQEIVGKFSDGVKNIAAISLGLGFPTVAALPHALIRGYENLVAISLTTGYSFPRAGIAHHVVNYDPVDTTTTSCDFPVDDEDPDMRLSLFD